MDINEKNVNSNLFDNLKKWRVEIILLRLNHLLKRE